MPNLKEICEKCQHVNTEKDIDYFNCMNEEGEDYYVFDLYCSGCNQKIYEGNNWGEFDLEEAIEEIKNR